MKAKVEKLEMLNRKKSNHLVFLITHFDGAMDVIAVYLFCSKWLFVFHDE
jgi:hypothetical protein